ncbi:MAG: translin family protein [Candidatus Thermoplasmatota archaeon]|nr:translin family protein [Candidatus Thermoplasmatota archaeon]
MINLEKVVTKIEEELDEKDQIREVALKSSRTVVRLSGGIMKSIHRDEDIAEALDDLKDEASMLSSLITDHPDLWSAGYVESAFQEYAEVGIILSILEKDDVPSPDDLGVSSVAYLLALGDSVGELRRLALDELKRSNVIRANYFLDRMEDLYTALMRFDYPDAIVAIRRKQDIARSLLEKTRGEVAVAASAKNLQEKLEEVLKKF